MKRASPGMKRQPKRSQRNLAAKKALPSPVSSGKARSNARQYRPVPGAGALASRVRFLRRQRSMTLEQLAATTGLTKSYLSKLERALSVPSISTAMRIAQSFGLSVGQLLGEAQYEDAISVVRQGSRPAFMRAGSSSGYDYEMLAGGKRFKSMEPFIMRPPLAYADERRFEHSGQELVFVLSGSIEVEYGGERHVLDQGDCAYYDAHIPHRLRSAGGMTAEAIVVVTTG